MPEGEAPGHAGGAPPTSALGIGTQMTWFGTTVTSTENWRGFPGYCAHFKIPRHLHIPEG